MPRVEMVGQSASDADNRQANTSRLINVFREPVGGTAGYQLKSVLGTTLLSTLTPSSGPTLNVRAIAEVGGKMYVVSGGTLFEVAADGSATELGFTRDREPTFLFGAEENKVCVVCGGRYYVWDGATLERPDPVDAPFGLFGSGVYLNGYVILTEDGGDRFQWTDLADATNFEGLNFATAESTDKPILQAAKVNGRLWLLKSDVIEVWAQVGSGANAFTRVQGGVIEVGLKGPSLATTFTGGIFFIGADNIVYLSSGEELQPISPPAVNTAVAQGNPTHVLYYEDEGHKFCAIRFGDRPAWVYDIVTGEWHERASGVEEAWDITATGLFNGRWYCGDRQGQFFRFDRTNVDGVQSLVRTMQTSTLYMDGAFFSVPVFEVTGRMGEGATDDTVQFYELHMGDGRVFTEDDVTPPLFFDGEPVTLDGVQLWLQGGSTLTGTWRSSTRYARGPQVGLELSGDGGRTWGEQITRSLGAPGEYERLARWRNLGGHYRLTARLRIAEERDITLDALANVEVA